jgi:hypothetical protein
LVSLFGSAIVIYSDPISILSTEHCRRLTTVATRYAYTRLCCIPQVELLGHVLTHVIHVVGPLLGRLLDQVHSVCRTDTSAPQHQECAVQHGGPWRISD